MKASGVVEGAGEAERPWQIWVDTGGTFTDCLAVDPRGRLHRAKVLSSSALRLRVAAVEGARSLRCVLERPWPSGFAVGARAQVLGDEEGAETAEVVAGEGDVLELSDSLDIAPGVTLELRFAEEAPVLAARWVTGTAAGRPLPPLALRLATTRGTNALLERRGARTAFLVTEGFADLLVIGDQRRANLFALDLRRPTPLYERVIEVPERLAADGRVLRPLDLEALAPALDALTEDGIEAVAVALLHSYRQPAHERALTAELARRGIDFLSPSAELAPLAKILPRAQTAVVDAYLAPLIGRYLDAVAGTLGSAGRLHVMTSAGGLVGRERYRAKDSLLSGPAGGVVGAARCGRELGYEKLIAFDMGGTSTDVSRIDGDFEYVFEHRVGDATVAAPALAVETVAAGGGSICWLDGAQAKVGPQSAGADPGPACYGAGGPLTLTDVNLLLGRLATDRFRIPVDVGAAERAADQLFAALSGDGADGPALQHEALLQGFRAIADERMADAVRRISVRRGYDPRDHALLAFGGAGGQHACAVAELLGIETLLAPRDAGLLSALGLGTAVVERFVQEQVMRPLAEVVATLPGLLERLAAQARAAVEAEGIPAAEVSLRRRLVFLRLVGQESTLEVELDDTGRGLEKTLTTAFAERYREIYGYSPPERPIEIESLRVVASSPPPEPDPATCPEETRFPEPIRRQRVHCGGGWREVPVFRSNTLDAGDGLAGPALVLDDYATLMVEPDWYATVASNGTLVLRRHEVPAHQG